MIDNPKRDATLSALDGGSTSIPSDLRLETETHADCLIECERGLLWVEGKRNDWLDSSTTWDLVRDQLARNLEAAWLRATDRGLDDFRVIVCHEDVLKWHEELLVDGYRSGSWAGGWPHLDNETRRNLGDRIRTVTWREITAHWPPLDLPE